MTEKREYVQKYSTEEKKKKRGRETKSKREKRETKSKRERREMTGKTLYGIIDLKFKKKKKMYRCRIEGSKHQSELNEKQRG